MQLGSACVNLISGVESVYRWKDGEGISVFLMPSGYTGDPAAYDGRERGFRVSVLFSVDGRKPPHDRARLVGHREARPAASVINPYELHLRSCSIP